MQIHVIHENAAWLEPLALRCGAVDEVLTTRELETPQWSEPEVAANLHGRGPESHRCLLSTRPRRLIAFSHPDVPVTSGMPRWRQDEHEVNRWCRLLQEHGITTDPSDLLLNPDQVPAARLTQGLPYNLTLLHPGAGQAARRWPAERWGAVARAELERGRSVAVTAGPGEDRLAAGVRAAAGDARVLVLRPAHVLELADVVRTAERVVCSDTGVAHLATALCIPSVVLFGPTPPAWWGPPASHPHVALWEGAFGDPRGCSPDPGLLRIRPRDVVAALERLDQHLAVG